MLIHNLVATGSAIVSGSSIITGNLTVLGSISGSINSAISASYALNATSASYALNATSASYSNNSTNTLSASYALNATSASYALNATSASYSNNSTNTLSASYAQTASYADTFTVAGTLTAQKLVVQTITSSIVYSSGSNVFGNSVSNTQSMTGSVGISGSLAVAGAGTFTAAVTPLLIKSTNATTMYTEYYYNTSTVSGYIGNGGGLLTGANNSDFIIRSEADFVVATGGNNRRLTIASTGAATFSGAVGVGISTPFTLENYNFVNTNGVSGGGLYMSKAGVGKAVVYSANDDLYLESTGSLVFATGGILGATPRLTIASTGASTFSKSVTINDAARIDAANGNQLILDNAGERFTQIDWYNNNSGKSVIFWDNTNNYFQIQSTPASSTIRAVAGTNGVELANGGTSWTGLSDIREKTIIKPITEAINAIRDFRTVIGRYKTDSEDVERSFLIAQDVQKTYPYAVTVGQDGNKTLRLAYTELIPLIIKAIQELKAEIDILKNKQ